MVEREAVRAAGDDARGLTVGEYLLTMTGDGPSLQLDAGETARRMGGIELDQYRFPDEISLLELHSPAERAAVRVGGVVHVLAVEPEPRLEAERVTRAQPARDQALRSSRLEERIPEPWGVGGIDIELEAVLAGVSGSRHGGLHAGHLAVPAVEGTKRGNVVGTHRADQLHGPGALHRE